MQHAKVVLLSAICLVFVCVLAVSGAGAAEGIGAVKKLSGQVSVVRGGETLPMAVGDPVFRDDVLTTGADGSLGFTLKDNTLISMGPNSSLSVAEYDFSPREGKLNLLTRMSKGTASYMSGAIGKLAPGAVSFETPDTTIGVRGTYFLVKVVDE